jgi:hypothetical protein
VQRHRKTTAAREQLDGGPSFAGGSRQVIQSKIPLSTYRHVMSLGGATDRTGARFTDTLLQADDTRIRRAPTPEGVFVVLPF